MILILTQIPCLLFFKFLRCSCESDCPSGGGRLHQGRGYCLGRALGHGDGPVAEDGRLAQEEVRTLVSSDGAPGSGRGPCVGRGTHRKRGGFPGPEDWEVSNRRKIGRASSFILWRENSIHVTCPSKIIPFF